MIEHFNYFYAPTGRIRGIEGSCASDVCLSFAYIAPKSTTGVERIKFAD